MDNNMFAYRVLQKETKTRDSVDEMFVVVKSPLNIHLGGRATICCDAMNAYTAMYLSAYRGGHRHS